jgi:hypothetical protein
LFSKNTREKEARAGVMAARSRKKGQNNLDRYEKQVHTTFPWMVGRLLVMGALAGIIAGVIMVIYAMIASATFLGQSWLTPLYGVASPLVGLMPLLLSLRQETYFATGPAALGLFIHLFWSALYGLLFALLVSFLHLHNEKAMLGGLVYSLAILVIMNFVVLPIVGAENLPTIIGGPSFLVEHLIFGIVLGLWPLVRPADIPCATQ